MQKPAFILISLLYLTGCASQVVTWPQHTPGWVGGQLQPSQYRGISQPVKTEQAAFRDAYLDAIRQIATELGVAVESQEVRQYGARNSVYDSGISGQLKTQFKHQVQDAHTVENYMERRGGRYKVYLLVTCDIERLRADMQDATARYRKLPPKGRSAEEHALWLTMDSLVSTAERRWKARKQSAHLKPIDREIDDHLRQAIERTDEMEVFDDSSGTKNILEGEYEKLAGARRRLTVRLRGDSSWTSVATGIPHRSKGSAFFYSLFPVGGGQIYMHNRRWLTAAQLGLGIAWGASSLWHNQKYNDFKDLRGVTRAELDAAYDDTKLPRTLRIGFGAGFGGIWLLNTILAVSDAGEYQELRRQSELAAFPTSRLEFTQNGIQLTRRF